MSVKNLKKYFSVLRLSMSDMAGKTCPPVPPATKTINGLSKNPNDNSTIEAEVRKEVVELCSKFPIYKHLR